MDSIIDLTAIDVPPQSDDGDAKNETSSLNKTISIDDDEDERDDELNTSLDERDAILKLSSFSLSHIRSVKSELEDLILRKIRKMDNVEKNEAAEKEAYICYFQNYAIDRVGNRVSHGETGIAEGWNIPKYENEYQNLLGLPFTEDHALSETLRIKRPRQECFNCLATSHRVTDCPIRIDEERIALHRKVFNSQAHHANEQAHLFQSRYTSDLDSKSNKGFVPGKFSEQLREALGLRSNQLPPFVYIMREYGYPTGWLIEAQVKSSNKLTVHNGDKKSEESANKSKKTLSTTTTTTAAITSDSIASSKEDGVVSDDVEYDQEKIYSFPGFNEQPHKDIIDESEKFRVKRYSHQFSKEKFLKTLNLLVKKSVVQRNRTKTVDEPFAVANNDTGADANTVETTVTDENEGGSSSKVVDTQDKDLTTELIDEENEGGDNGDDLSGDDLDATTATASDDCLPSKKKKRKSMHGTSFTEIPGTPIVNNRTGVSRVPDWEKFSENICAHKPFDMEHVATPGSTATPGGSYQNIVKLTRNFKSNSSLSSL